MAVEFAVGDLITYEHKSSHSGHKHICEIVGFADGWCLDKAHGTCYSTSFRPEEVIIWEHRKGKVKK